MRSDEFILVTKSAIVGTTKSGLAMWRYFDEITADKGIPLASSVGIQYLEREYPDCRTNRYFWVIKNTPENVAIVREYIRTKNRDLLHRIEEKF